MFNTSMYPPPLPNITGIADTAALCPTGCGMDGMDFIDPISSISAIVGPVMNYFGVKEQSKIAKKQIQFEQQQLKADKEQAARMAATDTAESFVQQSAEKRQEQVIALVAISAGAIILSSLFIFGAIKQKKG